MKTEKNILVAFILNLAFSVFEMVGGFFTGSVAIVSDAIHDIGDAASIGISYFLEKKSKKQPDEAYTYGYARFSVIGSVITTLILLVGSIAVIYNAVVRLIHPTEINYNGMIVFALVGASVNFLAAFFTRHGESLNQKAVNLHMLEDVLGWAVVLVGAVVMRVTDFGLLDSILSVAVAGYIAYHAWKNLRTVLDIFFEKTPEGINLSQLQTQIETLEGVLGTHHLHLWSMDGHRHCLTMHVVVEGDGHTIKEKIRAELKNYGIAHVTLELETPLEHCQEEQCNLEGIHHHGHCHHGHC
jgi:cobalt-zinc-cadmium efflux system protein